jgi:hypothetical protein
MLSEPFFRRAPEGFLPNDIARGPWDRESLHGRVIAGLLAQAIEQDFGDDEFVVNRLTVDMFRLPPFTTLHVSLEPVRQGGRIRVVDGVIEANGGEIARGRAVLLRRTEAPEGTVWSPPVWNAPHPDALEPERREETSEWVPMWESRRITGGFGDVMQKRMWMRENRRLIDEEPLTPFVRVALASDFTSPLAHSGDQGLQYINTDITLYLHRYPVDEWIGFEVDTHRAHAGIAVGACNLYDVEGPIGLGTVGALANRRSR